MLMRFKKKKIGGRKWAALLLLGISCLLCGCGSPKTEHGSDVPYGEISFENMHWEASGKLAYAECFEIEKSGEYELITIDDSGRFLLVSGENTIPEKVPEDVVILHTPIQKAYLSASSGFDLARQLGALKQIAFSGTKAKDLYIAEAAEAINSGSMSYAGKYSAPDFELLVGGECDLAIESTMIYHSPAIKEKLESLGIPVLVERSSYEPHPLGRMEWIKVYGALLGREEEAEAFFEAELSRLAPIMKQEKTECKVAFFYVNTNGAINVRKPGDYIAKMISLAGGVYVPGQAQEEEENALSSINMQMEDFYLAAKDADILIYNGNIAGELKNVEELIEKNSLFADFKAVQVNRVYCTGKDVFQEMTALGTLMEDMSTVVHGREENGLKQLTKLQ